MLLILLFSGPIYACAYYPHFDAADLAMDFALFDAYGLMAIRWQGYRDSRLAFAARADIWQCAARLHSQLHTHTPKTRRFTETFMADYSALILLPN